MATVTYGPTDARQCRCAVAIGASAGGVQALRVVAAALPVDLPAAVLIVLHLDPRARSLLPTLLRAVTALPVHDVRDESLVESGTIYVGVPDRHLFVADGRIRLGASAPLHHVRPSVDALFESVALGWSRGAVGVILTGSGSDGASGLMAIKHQGGATIVQDPGEAEFSGMPRAAVATGFADMIVPLDAIGPAIVRAVAAVAAQAA
jgi:two-component system chemotaxis response regulator CheB